MVLLVQKVLFPMDLKRYMVLSFATLWTLVLIIALIATLIHQTNYQDSASQLNLEWEIGGLQQDLVDKDKSILQLQETVISKDKHIDSLLSHWNW